MKRVIYYSLKVFIFYFLFQAFLLADFSNSGLLSSKIAHFIYKAQCMLTESSTLIDNMNTLWIFGVLILALGTAELIWPADSSKEKEQMGSDVVYVILAKIGVFGFILTSTTNPLLDRLEDFLTQTGVRFFHLGSYLADLRIPLALSAIIQWFIFDGFDTIRHRVEHYFAGLWAFHSVHHSQNQMTALTFERNHIVSLIYNSLVYVSLAKFLGIETEVLASIYFGFNFIEYLTHANINLSYGKILDRILVCPLYHRTHHARAKFPGPLHSVNFANIFPFWDIVLGSADFSYVHRQTGIFQGKEEVYGTSFFTNHLSGFRLCHKMLTSKWKKIQNKRGMFYLESRGENCSRQEG